MVVVRTGQAQEVAHKAGRVLDRVRFLAMFQNIEIKISFLLMKMYTCYDGTCVGAGENGSEKRRSQA